MMRRRINITLLTLLAVFACHTAPAQDTIPVPPKEKKLKLNGYLKELIIVTHPGAADSVMLDDIIHARLNLKWYPSSSFSGAASLRTRFFCGDMIRSNPAYDEALDRDSGFVDLSFVPLSGKAYVLHTTIDRLWLRWQHKKWEITAGRQRINWGLNLIWNPNDLFNTYSYIDFDYEERPGSDALRVQYYAGSMTVAELAIRPGRTIAQSVAAGLFKFNKKNFDIQIIGGMYRSDLVLGGGWAGNLKNWGFKGEASWFQPREHFMDTTGVLAASISFDRSFHSLYLHFSSLFNSAGASQLSQAGTLPGFALSPKQLSPFRYSLFAQASYPLLPILTLNIGAMFAPEDQTFFVMPSLSWSVKNNFDLLLVSQLFFGDVGSGYHPLTEIFVLRGKWSF